MPFRHRLTNAEPQGPAWVTNLELHGPTKPAERRPVILDAPKARSAPAPRRSAEPRPAAKPIELRQPENHRLLTHYVDRASPPFRARDAGTALRSPVSLPPAARQKLPPPLPRQKPPPPPLPRQKPPPPPVSRQKVPPLPARKQPTPPQPQVDREIEKRVPPASRPEETHREQPSFAAWLFARTTAIAIFAACGLNIFFLRWENFGFYWYHPLLNTYSIGVATFILSRFVISFFYRPPRDRGLEPTVTMIITAFNEEDAIYRTIECCFAVDYPRAKYEVVAVDDGSSDRTPQELQRARRRWQSLRVIQFEKNKGKREAMAAGARVASGDILVYVDSDSFLRRDALRKMVQGFADPSVAAVAGHTDVANVNRNMLTRMQDVRYYVAFRVLKAAESVFGAVTCCPGCFSAYRRSCVLPILDRWLHQRFLGVPATFGDDRSLTNFLLRHYKVIYSSEAIATTIVPDQHRKFLKQQLRWKKSWLRECLIAATFMWKKHPVAAVGFYAQLVFPILAPLLLLRALVWMPIFNADPMSMFLYGYGVLLIGLIFSSAHLFWNASGNWIYGAYFTLYYMLLLVWQMPYAIATSRDNRWGTR